MTQEHHTTQDEQQHDGRDEGRDESREHAALGVLLTVLHVRGSVEDLEQADDELRVDGEAVDEDEHEDRHTRPADGGDGHAEPDGQPVDVQQVVFDAGSSRACSSLRMYSEIRPAAIQLRERMPPGRLG